MRSGIRTGGICGVEHTGQEVVPRRDWREGVPCPMEGHCRGSPLTRVNSELFCPRATVEDRLFLPEGLRCPSDPSRTYAEMDCWGELYPLSQPQLNNF